MKTINIIAFYVNEAEEIKNNYSKATLSHKAGNIVTAGDTVERAVRDLVKRKIPNRYYASNGHIIDQHLQFSGQFDILIADDKGSPILASYDNGMDFLACESIYAIGEVKSSYSSKGKKEPVREFIEKIKFINENFLREEMDVFQRSQDYRSYGNNFGNSRTEDGWLYKNPLFKFMFFVQSTSLKLDKVINILESYERKHQPNLICLLDRGILIKVVTNHSENLSSNIIVENYPEFQREGLIYEWRLIEFAQIGAATLAYLIYALNFHLSRSVLSRADLMSYHEKLFQVTHWQ